METVITGDFLAIIIIFQPELRRALEQLGRGRYFSRSGVNEEEERKQRIESITEAVSYMAKRRIGALISIERETGMGDYIETGIPMNSNLTPELLINIFIPNTPLHDGAVVIQKNQIAAAACYLPLSESPFISKELGTRHRAALGISEVTDSLTIIVSEETGDVSITKNGELHRGLSDEEFPPTSRKRANSSSINPSSLPHQFGNEGRRQKMDKFMDNPWIVRIVALVLAILLTVSVNNIGKKEAGSMPNGMENNDAETIANIPVELYL